MRTQVQTLQECDRFAFDRFDSFAIHGRLRKELLRREETPNVVLVTEVETMPVDDGSTTENEFDAFKIDERKIAERREAMGFSVGPKTCAHRTALSRKIAWGRFMQRFLRENVLYCEQ